MPSRSRPPPRRRAASSSGATATTSPIIAARRRHRLRRRGGSGRRDRAVARAHERHALGRAAPVARRGGGGHDHGRGRRRALEEGLWLPLDPGASEQSQIGGNVATGAGGPHAFKYGTARAFVTGLEAVLAPGEVVQTSGFARKDVASYDLTGLLCGSEGTLGVITSVRLRLIPPPEAELPVAAVYPDAAAGCAAVLRVLGSGLMPATLEYLDAGALDAARVRLPGRAAGGGGLPRARPGGRRRGRRPPSGGRAEGGPRRRRARPSRSRRRATWRAGVTACRSRSWRSSAGRSARTWPCRSSTCGRRSRRPCRSGAATGFGHCRGGTPATATSTRRSSLAADDAERAEPARAELFDLAVRLGGTISGEHGLGSVKDGRRYRDGSLTAAHDRIKRALDPKGLLNPGKKR